MHVPNYPPAQNQYTQEKILGEFIFARVHAGPVFARVRIQENILEEVFPEYFAKFLGELTLCEYMPRLYSHPREYRNIFLGGANYLCIGRARGYFSWHVLYVLSPLFLMACSEQCSPLAHAITLHHVHMISTLVLLVLLSV